MNVSIENENLDEISSETPIEETETKKPNKTEQVKEYFVNAKYYEKFFYVPYYKKIWFWVLASVALLCLILGIVFSALASTNVSNSSYTAFLALAIVFFIFFTILLALVIVFSVYNWKNKPKDYYDEELATQSSENEFTEYENDDEDEEDISNEEKVAEYLKNNQPVDIVEHKFVFDNIEDIEQEETVKELKQAIELDEDIIEFEEFEEPKNKKHKDDEKIDEFLLIEPEEEVEDIQITTQQEPEIIEFEEIQPEPVIITEPNETKSEPPYDIVEGFDFAPIEDNNTDSDFNNFPELNYHKNNEDDIKQDDNKLKTESTPMQQSSLPYDTVKGFDFDPIGDDLITDYFNFNTKSNNTQNSKSLFKTNSNWGSKLSQEEIQKRENQVISAASEADLDNYDGPLTIMISLQDSEAKKIIEEGKTALFFKKLPTKPVTRAIIYLVKTHDHPGMVIGEFDIEKLEDGAKTTIWNKYGNISTLSRSEFLEYYEEAKKVHAMFINDFIAYSNPKSLENYNMKKGPSGFTYLK